MTILVPLFRFLSEGTENVLHLHLPQSLTPLLHIVDAHYWENEGPNIYQVSIQWQTLCWRHLHTLPLFWATLLWEYLSQFRNVPEIKLGTGGEFSEGSVVRPRDFHWWGTVQFLVKEGKLPARWVGWPKVGERGKNWDSIQGFSNFTACFLFFSDIWTASSSYYFHHHHLLRTLLGIILKPYVPTHFILKIILSGMSFYNLNFYSWENEAED